MSHRPTPTALQARAKAAAARRDPQARPITVLSTTNADDDADAPSTRSAELWLYGTVGGYWWGFDAEDVATELRGMGDVDEVTVRLHSFGGSALEGIAIANLLANHSARVRVVVDGMAASAASMIALAGAELVMSPGSQLMVHDAWMYVCGNAAELRVEADWLDKQSQNYAETYAARSGGTAAEWRDRMTAEGDGTWFTAAEAVEAGLADRVENIASTQPPPPLPDLEDLDDEGVLAAAVAYDLELLHPAARTALTSRRTSAPKPPAASAPGSIPTRTKETAMAFTPEQLTQMRQDLGLAETADEATIVAALSEALAEQADEPAATTPTLPEGVTTISTEVLADLQAQAREGAEARAQQRTETRDRAIDAAVSEGRIAPAQREHFTTLYDADPTGTVAVLSKLAANTVPVRELGHGEAAQTSDDALYAEIYPTTKEA